MMFLGIFLAIGILIYFLPTILSGNHPGQGGIFVVNLFLGWTLLGWLIALAWALNGQKK